MKYMGSKRWMLGNGLGTLLQSECVGAKRFVDLFTGSGAVAAFVAERIPVTVHAVDLQCFAVVLAEAVIAREERIDSDVVWDAWLARAKKVLPHQRVPRAAKCSQGEVAACRAWSTEQISWSFVSAYGGHYYSPKQAIWIDALRRSVPSETPARTVALAALLQAASKCAASPGHTAQPFQPTRTAKKFLLDAWERDVLSCTQQALETLAPRFAMKKGVANVADAEVAASDLLPGDIAFIDPPYSGVQYSRFYHVLEAIAKGETGEVSGAGRYPDKVLRPQSKMSLKTTAHEAMKSLLKTVAEKRAKAIVTFPDHECSNGLSGALLRETAAEYFHVRAKTVESRFSTLGGNNTAVGNGREARRVTSELILTLTPRT